MRDRPRYFCYFVLLPFGRLPSALVQHVRQIHIVNAILLFLRSLLSSFTFSPTVHSLLFWLLAMSHQSCAILFLFLVSTSSFSVRRLLVSRSSLSVTRCQLLVFRFHVSRSSLAVRYHGVITVDFYVFLAF